MIHKASRSIIFHLLYLLWICLMHIFPELLANHINHQLCVTFPMTDELCPSKTLAINVSDIVGKLRWKRCLNGGHGFLFLQFSSIELLVEVK